MDTMEAFWMVIGRDMPTVRHTSEEEAKREAQRLARLYVGQKFYVLKAVIVCEKADVTTTLLAEPDLTMPF